MYSEDHVVYKYCSDFTSNYLNSESTVIIIDIVGAIDVEGPRRPSGDSIVPRRLRRLQKLYNIYEPECRIVVQLVFSHNTPRTYNNKQYLTNWSSYYFIANWKIFQIKYMRQLKNTLKHVILFTRPALNSKIVFVVFSRQKHALQENPTVE